MWLDAAALKRRKVQTQLIKLGTKMLTLLPGERTRNTPFTPRGGTRQTSITSFVTSQPGMANGGNQKDIFSLKESQINKECKRTQPDCLAQGLEDDFLVSPLVTSTPADIQEAGHCLQSPQSSGCRSLETSLTMMSVPQPDVLMGTGESKGPLESSFTQFLERSRLVDQREAKRKREGLRGSKTDCPGMGSHIRAPGGKYRQPLDKAEVEKKGPAQNRQAPVHLQTYRSGSCSRKQTLLATKNPCPLSVCSWDSERNDRDSWSQLFTEDSQGQQVIAHNTKMPFRDVTNARNRGSGQFPDSPQAQGQDGPTQFHLQSHLLFTQDSEGNRVIRH